MEVNSSIQLLISLCKAQVIINTEPNELVDGESGQVIINTEPNELVDGESVQVIINTEPNGLVDAESGQVIINTESNELVEGQSGNVTCIYNNAYSISMSRSVSKQRDDGYWGCGVQGLQSETPINNTTIDVKVPVKGVEIENKNSLNLVNGVSTKMNCKVTNNPDPVINYRWFIVFLILDKPNKPSVKIEPEVSGNYKIIEGNTVELKCIVTDANPDGSLSYKWYKDTITTPTGQVGSTVQISKKGIYTCSVSNGIGTPGISDSITIDVLFPPRVTLTPQYSIIESNNLTIPYGPEVRVSTSRIDIIESNKLVINCTVIQSKPDDASINWYKPDGTSISSNVLSIDNTRRDQGGIYSCNSSKVLKPSIGTTKTNVDSKTTIVNIWYLDRVKITRTKLDIQEGDKINITCTTQSNPTASITYRNGTDVIQTDNSNQASFIKLAATCLDTNVYSCQVNNPNIPQTSYNDTIQILVNCKYSFSDTNKQNVEFITVKSPRPDPRVDHQYKITGNIGESVEITAQVISYPKPIFQWYYRENNVDIPIVNNGSFQQTNISTNINTFISKLTINITTNKFYRRYYLNVSNEVNPGGSDLQYDIISETVPDRPINITYKNITSDTICIEWTPGFNGGASQSFIVQHSTDDKTWVNSSTILDDTNNGRVDYCIEGLEPDTSYYIRVIASNKYGESLIGILSQSEPPKTASRQGKMYETMKNSIPTLFITLSQNMSSNEFDVVGLDIGIVLAILAAVVVGVILYKWRQGKGKEEETYDSIDPRIRADGQTYQELNTVHNTVTPQASDAARYYNLRAGQTTTDLDDTRPYANL
ncbi:hypothetical protein LOTGIDRAFT_239094 [Lottia gigantea]|uniref:Uncharacterized protein n=1 Tax=Lottia gigantea TaxID=225164 RepID=V4AT87_LOTGI|nr:hypothetical protein LOTGIDRAFT_239094 [Lottia gigantea]ESO98105.1 hypothetical protein LOTGIDRAFT_239094 [Lottia gigantea]